MRPSLKEFKKKALANPEVAEEYNRLSSAYALRKQLIKMRQSAGFTQEEIAEILHTKKSNISRLENVNSKISPKLSTIEEYAKAAGYKLEINFVPRSVNKKTD
ncbi:MAG: helix-turn-helix transcriptional regulator [Desulfocapsaceae bacterium]|nr:helix-turn-helix transcriptional regulator [Desulfocapsaceae bacterium]